MTTQEASSRPALFKPLTHYENMDKVGNWQGFFCGCSEEMSLLQEKWNEVNSAPTEPRMVVILGESGLGKTRLIQEFYYWLSTHIDGKGKSGYWPDSLTRTNNNLSINPEIEDCQPLNKMPYLWWGIRAQDPGGRNKSAGCVTEAVNFLKPHLGFMELSRQKKELNEKIKSTLKEGAYFAATEAANIFSFGILGSLKSAIDLGSQSLEIYQEYKTTQGVTVSPVQLNETRKQERLELLLSDLSCLFEAPAKDGKRIPGIIFFDDAHWAHEDDELSELIKKTIQISQKENWPVLIIVTHWEREWLQESKSAEKFSGICHSLDNRNFITTHTMERNSSLNEMLSAAFPGLTSYQRRLIDEKAGGNPRLMDEILRKLSRKPGLFIGRDMSKKLKKSSEEWLSGARFQLHELVEERFCEAPEDVQVAISLSSFQGARFLEELTANTARRLLNKDVSLSLSEADTPHSFVKRLGDGFSEFSQRVYQEVAREKAEDFWDDESEVTSSICDAIQDLAGNEAEFSQLPDSQREIAWTIGIFLLSGCKNDNLKLRTAALCHYQMILHKGKISSYKASGEIAARLTQDQSTLLNFLSYQQICEIFDALWRAGLYREADRLSDNIYLKKTTMTDMQKCEMLCRKGEAIWATKGPLKSKKHFEIAYEKLCKLQKDGYKYHILKGRIYGGLGGAHWAIEGPKSSLRFLKERVRNVKISYELIGTHETKEMLVKALLDYSKCLLLSKKIGPAEHFSNEALKAAKDTKDKFPTDVEQSLTSEYFLNKALIQQERKDYQGSIASYSVSIKTLQELVEKSRLSKHKLNLALALQRLANCLNLAGDKTSAASSSIQSIYIARQALEETDTPESKKSVAFCLTTYANSLSNEEEFEDASIYYGEAAKLLEESALETKTTPAYEMAFNSLSLAIKTFAKLGDKEKVKDHHERKTVFANMIVKDLLDSTDNQENELDAYTLLEKTSRLTIDLEPRECLPYFSRIAEIARSQYFSSPHISELSFWATAQMELANMTEITRGPSESLPHYETALVLWNEMERFLKNDIISPGTEIVIHKLKSLYLSLEKKDQAEACEDLIKLGNGNPAEVNDHVDNYLIKTRNGALHIGRG